MIYLILLDYLLINTKYTFNIYDSKDPEEARLLKNMENIYSKKKSAKKKDFEQKWLSKIKFPHHPCDIICYNLFPMV